MPNWCENIVTITFDTQAEYDKFIADADIDESTSQYLEGMSDEAKVPFFDKFVPTPPELLEGEGWYNWRNGNWGTKWNPEVYEFWTHDENKKIEIHMNTAWAPPIEFFIKFSELYSNSITELMYVEMGLNFCGVAEFEDGSVSDAYINDVPTEGWVMAGAVLDKEGHIDWDESDIDMFTVLKDNDKFLELVSISN